MQAGRNETPSTGERELVPMTPTTSASVGGPAALQTSPSPILLTPRYYCLTENDEGLKGAS